MSETFDAPQSRNEAILQNILGAENELGDPQSRIEELLQEILEQGGGGKKQYQHNIFLFGSGKSSSVSITSRIAFAIINDQSTEMDATSINEYLVEKGFVYDWETGADRLLSASGDTIVSGNIGIAIGITTISGDTAIRYEAGSSYSDVRLSFFNIALEITDTVVEI